ncbi:MFS transporter [Chloroflexota bacterium]
MVDKTPRITSKSHPPTWLILGLASLVMIVEGISLQGIPVLYPFIQSDLSLSNSQIGIITSALMVVSLFTSLFGGWLADVYGVKRVLLLSLLTITVIIAALPFTRSFIMLLLVVTLIGAVNAPITPSTAIIISSWIPQRIFGFAMSFKQTGFSVGGSIGAAILPALGLMLGWRLAGGTIGILVLLIAVTFGIYYRDAPVKDGSSAVFSLTSFVRNVKVIVNKRSLLVPLFWSFIFAGLHWVFLSYFLLFLIKDIGISPILAGGLLSLSQIISSGARIFWGIVSDLSLLRGNRIVVLAIIGVSSTMTYIGISLIKPDINLILIYIIATTAGLSILSWPGILIAIISESTDPDKIGISTGLMVALSRSGIVVMPPLFGWLIDTSGSYEIAWQLAGGLALASTAVLILFGRPRRIPD